MGVGRCANRARCTPVPHFSRKTCFQEKATPPVEQPPPHRHGEFGGPVCTTHTSRTAQIASHSAFAVGESPIAARCAKSLLSQRLPHSEISLRCRASLDGRRAFFLSTNSVTEVRNRYGIACRPPAVHLPSYIMRGSASHNRTSGLPARKDAKCVGFSPRALVYSLGSRQVAINNNSSSE